MGKKPTFDKDTPLTMQNITFPGRGLQPDYCCSLNSGRGHVVSVNVDEHFSTEYGHHVCHMYACPDCAEHMILSGVFHAIGYLKAVQHSHPGSKIYQLRFTLRNQENASKNNVGKNIRSLKDFINNSEGVYGGVYSIHSGQIKKFVEDKINECYPIDYEEPLTRTQLYRSASDLDYLHHIGFTNFRDWREAFDLLWHVHVFVVADHFPEELRLHGNMKNPAAKLLTGGPHKRFSLIFKPENNLQNLPTHRPDGSLCHWYRCEFDHSYDGADLSRALYYCHSHCAITNTPGLEFRVLCRFGECYKINDLDFIEDGYTFQKDPYTKKRRLVSFDPTICDPRVLDALETLQQAFPSTHRRGKFVYPGWEEVPPFNEDLPAQTQLEPPLTRINVQVFRLRTEYKDGIRVPSDGAEYTYKLQDEFIELLQKAESIGIIPSRFSVKYSDCWRAALNTWNKRCLDPKLRAKDRLLYTTDFAGFEEFAKSGLFNDLGYISKSTAYRPPTGLDFEKIKVAIIHGLDTLNHLSRLNLPLKQTKALFSLSMSKDLQEYAVDYYHRKAQEEDPFYDDFERLHNNAVEIKHTAKKPCRKHEHGNPGYLRAAQFFKKLQESFDDDFDSVEKLSWITSLEDSEEEDDY